jgi:hypothetical protein
MPCHLAVEDDQARRRDSEEMIILPVSTEPHGTGYDAVCFTA